MEGVADPQLPRKRRAPRRTEVGDRSTNYVPSTTKEHARHMYYSAVDVTIECIPTRFNQKAFKVYQSTQVLILRAIAGEDHGEELMKVMPVQGCRDLQRYKLEPKLSLLPDMVQSIGYDTFRFDIADLLDFFQSLGNARRKLLLSGICTLGISLRLSCQLPTPTKNALSLL